MTENTAAARAAAAPRRLNWYKIDPDAYQAMMRMEEISSHQLDPALRELVKMRASGLNGCAYCLDMHARDAAAQGETLQRLVVVGAWEEAEHLFTPREQAALALTDAVTRLGQHGVPDEVWERAAGQFDEKELVHLLMAIVTINAWNRLAVTTQAYVKPQD